MLYLLFVIATPLQSIKKHITNTLRRKKYQFVKRFWRLFVTALVFQWVFESALHLNSKTQVNVTRQTLIKNQQTLLIVFDNRQKHAI